MIHPDIELKFVNELVGYGLFAKKFIPKGSVVYVKDDLDVVLTQAEVDSKPKAIQDILNKYSYFDKAGNYIFCWDFGRYENHCCNYNTVSTYYMLDVACADIQAGEQITCDYLAWENKSDMQLFCDKPNCRKILRKDDFEPYYKDWDIKAVESLKHYNQIPQPIIDCLQEPWKSEFLDYLSGKSEFKSSYYLRRG